MKTLQVAICLLLIVGVLAMSLSVIAVDPTPTPTPIPANSDAETFYEWYENHAQITGEDAESAWQALGVYGIWAILNGMGIRVTANQIYQWSDEMYYAIEQLMFEYLDDVGINLIQWILPWTMSFNDLGLFMANSDMVSDAQDFANWLIQEFNLTDYSDATITSSIVIPAENQAGVNVYIPAFYIQQPLGNWYPYIQGDADFYSLYHGFVVNEIYELLSGYYARWYDNGSTVTLQISRNSDFVTNVISEQWISGDNYTKFKTNYRLTAGYNGSNTIPIFYVEDYQTNYPYKFIITAVYDRDNNRTSASYSINRESNFINTYFMPQNYGNNIITYDIQLPSDSGWEPGDGVIVDGDNNYLHVIIENPIEVKNLPAIIAQRIIPDIGNDENNPGFSVPWQAINGLIQYVAAPAGAIMSLVNEAPVEGVIMLYALIGGIIIFGMIRVMREH